MILLVGSIFDGIRLYGPFDELEDAKDYAEQFYPGEEWSVTCPVKPKCDEGSGDWVAPWDCKLGRSLPEVDDICEECGRTLPGHSEHCGRPFSSR